MLSWLGLGSQQPKVGAIDVIAIKRKDNNISCGPFHVRFNKGVKKTDKKIVKVKVNGNDSGLSMKLGSAGEAYFIERTREKVLRGLRTSPIHSPIISPINVNEIELPSLDLNESKTLNDTTFTLLDNNDSIM